MCIACRSDSRQNPPSFKMAERRATPGIGRNTPRNGGSPHRHTPQVVESREGKMRGEQLESKKPSSVERFELLTAEELADRLRVPTSWVREQTRSRSLEGDPLPHLRLGRYVRFQWGSPELERWLRRRLCEKSSSSHPVC
jgi:hypothetical protein